MYTTREQRTIACDLPNGFVVTIDERHKGFQIYAGDRVVRDVLNVAPNGIDNIELLNSEGDFAVLESFGTVKTFNQAGDYLRSICTPAMWMTVYAPDRLLIREVTFTRMRSHVSEYKIYHADGALERRCERISGHLRSNPMIVLNNGKILELRNLRDDLGSHHPKGITFFLFDVDDNLKPTQLQPILASMNGKEVDTFVINSLLVCNENNYFAVGLRDHMVLYNLNTGHIEQMIEKSREHKALGLRFNAHECAKILRGMGYDPDSRGKPVFDYVLK